MRVFYIFQIKKDLTKITKENPYTLFHTLETIYYREPDDIKLGYVFLKQIIKIHISMQDINLSLFKKIACIPKSKKEQALLKTYFL